MKHRCGDKYELLLTLLRSYNIFFYFKNSQRIFLNTSNKVIFNNFVLNRNLQSITEIFFHSLWFFLHNPKFVKSSLYFQRLKSFRIKLNEKTSNQNLFARKLQISICITNEISVLSIPGELAETQVVEIDEYREISSTSSNNPFFELRAWVKTPESNFSD